MSVGLQVQVTGGRWWEGKRVDGEGAREGGEGDGGFINNN